jgi:ribosome-associated protein
MIKKLLKKRDFATSLEKAKVIKTIALECLADDKAEDVVEIDLAGKADFAHYMVVASGRSTRHVSAMADKLADKLISEGFGGIGIEGKNTGDWVLIDAYDVVIHLFRDEVRKDYELEKMWDMKN